MTSTNTKDAAPAASRPPLTADQARVHVREQWLALRTINGNGHASKIAIMGAGRHTSWLQSAVHGVNGPTVVAVLDDVPAGKSHFWGYYPVSPTAWDPTACDAIVLSTDSVPGAMQARLQQVYGKAIRIVNLYEGLPPGPYPKSSPSAGPKPAQPSSPTPIPATPSKWASLLAAIQARRDRRDEPYLPDPRLVRREHDRQWKHDYARYARRLESRFKDCHHGREAILIGNGPSVRTDDFEKFKGFVTFACNRFYQCYDRTAFRPSYLVTADASMVSDFGPEMAAKAECPLFINTADETPIKGKNVFWLPSTVPNLSPLAFQNTMYRGLYSGGGTLIAALQIGYYMGIRRFYLYGVDHSFTFDLTDSKDKFRSATGDNNHFIANYRDGKAWCPPASHLIEQSFMICDKTLRSNGGFLKNATHGGTLEVLERVDIEQVTTLSQDRLLRYYNPETRLTSRPTSTSKRPRILMVSPTPPLPAYIGNRVVTNNMIKHLLGLGYDVDLVLQNPHFDEEMTEQDLRSHYGDRVRVIQTEAPLHISNTEQQIRQFIKAFAKSAPLTGRMKPLGFFIYCIANRVHPYRYCAQDTLDCARTLIASTRYDGVIFNYLHFLRIANALGRHQMPRSLVLTHDAHSRVDIQGYSLGMDTRHRACSPAAERSVLSEANVVAAISSQEKTYFEALGVNAHIIRTEIDLYESMAHNPVRLDAFNEKTILLVASANQLNRAGLATFLSEVWPVIRSVLPEARLRVAGHVCRFVPKETVNVDILGTLQHEDLIAELTRATLMVNPVFQGTGLKIKSVLSICAGLPMVTVPCGADGLEDLGGRAFLVADNWRDFSLHCLKLLTDQPLWTSTRQNALDAAKLRFGEKAVYEQLDAAMGWTCQNESAVASPTLTPAPVRPVTKLLMVSIIPPFPDVQGNRIVMRKMLDHYVKQGAQIDLVLQAPCDAAHILSHYKGSVTPVLTRCRNYPPPKEKELRHMLKTMAQDPSLFPGYNKEIATELAEALNHFHPFEYITEDTVVAVRALLQKQEYDAILCNYLYSLRVVHELKHEFHLPPSFVITIDAVSLQNRQAVQHGMDTSHRACSAATEVACLNAADHVIAITTKEMDYFRNAGTHNLLLSEFPAYEELKSYRIQDSAFDRKIISIAGSGNPLNVGGLGAFIESAWPTIARNVPGAQLHVFGAVSEKLSTDDARIIRRGILPRDEMLRELTLSTISINPVLLGTGLKIKSVEAFCMGIPLVSLPVGIEGMEEFADHGCLVAKDWQQFAAQCERLLSDRNLWLRMRDESVMLAQSRFSEQTVYGEMDSALYGHCNNAIKNDGVFSRIPPNTSVAICGTDEPAQDFARRLSRARPHVSILGFVGATSARTLFGLPVYSIDQLLKAFPLHKAPLLVIVSKAAREIGEQLRSLNICRFVTFPLAGDSTQSAVPVKNSATQSVSDPLLGALPRLLQRIEAGKWQRIALYGGGQHTRRLLSQWKAATACTPVITCLFDDNATGSIEGFPIVKPTDFATHAPQAVIISSDAFEDTLYQRAMNHHFGVPVLRMYGSDATATPSSTPSLHSLEHSSTRTEHAMTHSAQRPAHTGDLLSVALQKLISQVRSAQWSKIALYGGGKHTRRLLTAWKAEKTLTTDIACILDDKIFGHLEGIPIVPPSQCGAYSPQALIISSDAFEEQLYAQASKAALGIPILRMYSHDDTPVVRIAPFDRYMEHHNDIVGPMRIECAYLIASVMRMLAKLSPEGNVMEMGVLNGRSAIPAACFLKEGECFVAVDPFENIDNVSTLRYGGQTQADIFLGNWKTVFGTTDNIRVLRKTSETVHMNADGLAPHSFKYVSVDGNHSYEGSLYDLQLAAKLVSANGIIAIDDVFNMEWPSVGQALNEFLQSTPDIKPFCVGWGRLFLCNKRSHDQYRSATKGEFALVGKSLEFLRILEAFPFHGTPIDVYTNRWGSASKQDLLPDAYSIGVRYQQLLKDNPQRAKELRALASLATSPAPDITTGARAEDVCSKEAPVRKEAPIPHPPTVPAAATDPLEQPLARLAATMRASQWTKIALYGAGKHSNKLMAAWTRPDLALPSIACILDDNASGNLCGIPIVRPTDCKGHAPQAIVISSDAFETKLCEQALKHNLGIPILRLYATNESPNAIAVQALLKNIRALPSDWHSVGTFAPESLNAIAAFATQRRIRNSMETGAGTSTLLLSHLSQQHTTFALDLGGSISAVKASPLFNAANVRWVEGPSQLTLPRHQFTGLLDFALIDGPHAYPFPDMEYYYIYPHLAPDALLVVDDIQIPTITNLFHFLKEEEMFSLEQVVGRTAFFRRTHTHTFPTQYDGWPLQGFNRKHFPVGNDQAMKVRLASETQNEIRAWRAKDTQINA